MHEGSEASPHEAVAGGRRDGTERRTSICLVIGLEKETVSERISKIGFGWYQVQCFGFCCGFIVAEAAELAMASGIVRCIGHDFGIESDLGLSMLMTATFAGLAAGSLLSGPMGDCCGRRAPMAIGTVGIPCTALLTFFAPTLYAVYCLRFVLGAFAGLGIPMAVVILSEVSPKHLRGISVAAMGLAWCLGEFYAAAGLLFLAPDLQRGPWRKLVLWAAGPSVKLLVCALFSPVTRYDTAHWLGAQGRTDEMVEALNLMARVNCRPHLSLGECRNLTVEMGSEPVDGACAGLAQLARAPFAAYACAQALLCFAKDFALYGAAVLWPLAWASVEAVGPVQPAGELMGTALLGIPGVGLAMCLMHAIPRRLALGCAAICCAAACWALLDLEHGSLEGFAGVALFKLLFPTWQMVTMLLPAEIFPTQIKSCGYAATMVFGRLATILAPTVVGLSRPAFLLSTFALAVASALVAQLLPETRGADLPDAAAGRGGGKAAALLRQEAEGDTRYGAA